MSQQAELMMVIASLRTVTTIPKKETSRANGQHAARYLTQETGLFVQKGGGVTRFLAASKARRCLTNCQKSKI
jgi:hypothetical protein